MADNTLLNKEALDKEEKKLGKIIRIDKLSSAEKKDIPYAIIHVKEMLKEDIRVPIKAVDLIEVREEAVLFNITKKDFDEQVEKQRAIAKQISSLRKIDTQKKKYRMDTLK